MRSCRNLRNGSLRKMQLTLEDGGQDLSRTNVDFYTLFMNARNIFEGLVELDREKKVHFDIKELNIVYNEESKQMLLIDFELMEDYGKLYHERRMLHPYVYYPPEFEINQDIFDAIFNNKISKMMRSEYNAKLPNYDFLLDENYGSLYKTLKIIRKALSSVTDGLNRKSEGIMRRHIPIDAVGFKFMLSFECSSFFFLVSQTCAASKTPRVLLLSFHPRT